MKLVWSRRAQNDLIGVGEFISRHAPDSARKHVQLLVERAKQAAQFPQAGRIVPEYGQEALREIIEGNYRIVYEVNTTQKTVTVLTVFEAHRLILIRKGE